MKHYSAEETQKIWTLFKHKVQGRDFGGYLDYFLGKFPDDISGINVETLDTTPYAEQSQTNLHGNQQIRQDILVNQGLVEFFKSETLNPVLLMNSMTINELVDFEGNPNSQRDILELTPFELTNAGFGKHYLPEVVFTSKQLDWAILLDADDTFHICGSETFVKKFDVFMRRFVQPYMAQGIH